MSLIPVVFRSEFLWCTHMHTLTVIKNGGPNKPLWFHGIKSNWLPDCHSSSLIKRLRPGATSLSSGLIIDPPHQTPPTRLHPPMPPAIPKISFDKDPQISRCLLISNTPPPPCVRIRTSCEGEDDEARTCAASVGDDNRRSAGTRLGPLGPSSRQWRDTRGFSCFSVFPSFDVNNRWCF